MSSSELPSELDSADVPAAAPSHSLFLWQYEFEQSLMEEQAEYKQQAVAVETKIKTAALETAAKADEVGKLIRRENDTSMVDFVNALSSKRCEGPTSFIRMNPDECNHSVEAVNTDAGSTAEIPATVPSHSMFLWQYEFEQSLMEEQLQYQQQAVAVETTTKTAALKIAAKADEIEKLIKQENNTSMVDLVNSLSSRRLGADGVRPQLVPNCPIRLEKGGTRKEMTSGKSEERGSSKHRSRSRSRERRGDRGKEGRRKRSRSRSVKRGRHRTRSRERGKHQSRSRTRKSHVSRESYRNQSRSRSRSRKRCSHRSRSRERRRHRSKERRSRRDRSRSRSCSGIRESFGSGETGKILISPESRSPSKGFTRDETRCPASSS